MTKEEAIYWLDNGWRQSLEGKYREAFDMTISALRSLTREQIEKAWRGKWVGMTDDDGCVWYECSRCEYDLDSLEDPNHFCPACGAPMTDEAVDIVMKRLEALKDAAD